MLLRTKVFTMEDMRLKYRWQRVEEEPSGNGSEWKVSGSTEQF